MKKYYLPVAFFFIWGNVVFSQTHQWQQQANYDIAVTLDDAGHTLNGIEHITYINNSPDTLRFIYIHLWMNAYKNDRTAFSEQLLINDRTDFYFSDEVDRGYINRLNFTVNNSVLITEETKDIDVIKLLLQQPLVPADSVKITTPFFVKLPYNFSRSGHYKQSYQVTQWYPKAALYDKDGWHAMPYLDQGEFYNDFGNYHVHISLPENYKVGATGVLQSVESAQVSLPNNIIPIEDEPKKKLKPFFPKKIKTDEDDMTPASSKKWVTRHYAAERVTDFAWFADKTFIIKTDTVRLATHTIKANCYILPENEELYSNSMRFVKQAVRFYSNELGEYPYPEVNVVSAPKALTYVTSMEYPMITLITEETEEETDATIAHEIGHNWLMGILATNERDHGWMDEGINTYYERKYRRTYYPEPLVQKNPLNFSGLNGAAVQALLQNLIAVKKDQPIETTSAAFSSSNYGAIVYEKTASWMELTEKTVTPKVMLQSMRNYYQHYSFHHPVPADLQKVIEGTSNQNLATLFHKLNEAGYLDSSKINKPIKLKGPVPGFDNKYNYITIAPALGYNHYDKVMVGAVIHNYQLPLKKFHFLAAPLYATGTSTLNGVARVNYNHFTKRNWLDVSVSGMKYSINEFETGNDNLQMSLTRIVPSVKLSLYNKDLREKDKWVFQFQSFILNEEKLDFKTVITPEDTFDMAYKRKESSIINRLKIGYENNRILYPYNANITIDQGEKFIRAGFTANYFFNYKTEGQGMNLRVFAGKFFYTVSKTLLNDFNTRRYQLNMSGANGNEDYTYSNYFIGRNEFEGWQSQQMMERDGFFKVRTDLLGDKIGKTDDWLLAANLSGNIPDAINPLSVLPFRLPLKFFIDIGTYSEAWKDNAATGRFIYDAGLQLSVFKNGVNIYIPLLYSKVYSEYFKTILGEKRFLKTISFNINLDIFKPVNWQRNIPL